MYVADVRKLPINDGSVREATKLATKSRDIKVSESRLFSIFTRFRKAPPFHTA